MTGEKILKGFIERVNKIPKRDLSKKEDFHAFCERLSEATRPEMEAKDRLRTSSLAKSGDKLFG